MQTPSETEDTFGFTAAQHWLHNTTISTKALQNDISSILPILPVMVSSAQMPFDDTRRENSYHSLEGFTALITSPTCFSHAFLSPTQLQEVPNSCFSAQSCPGSYQSVDILGFTLKYDFSVQLQHFHDFVQCYLGCHPFTFRLASDEEIAEEILCWGTDQCSKFAAHIERRSYAELRNPHLRLKREARNAQRQLARMRAEEALAEQTIREPQIEDMRTLGECFRDGQNAGDEMELGEKGKESLEFVSGGKRACHVGCEEGTRKRAAIC
ncbi:uncharacterized protein LY89DRAFT_741782 [Mollisia scopiformis]|uniref:Uncharacterized protein n=1 Tax=Mollisia scopiformis TaxID=149040 RepID=A0A132B7N9_MOLSC|nr:uncharacterized protein LY89DRAFT_741782 [Mollisia scopiformis]KUJ08412.1 hypothetical protein LY89DRAFT_741782 [Mollisia scopiformis]